MSDVRSEDERINAQADLRRDARQETAILRGGRGRLALEDAPASWWFRGVRQPSAMSEVVWGWKVGFASLLGPFVVSLRRDAMISPAAEDTRRALKRRLTYPCLISSRHCLTRRSQLVKNGSGETSLTYHPPNEAEQPHLPSRQYEAFHRRRLARS